MSTKSNFKIKNGLSVDGTQVIDSTANATFNNITANSINILNGIFGTDQYARDSVNSASLYANTGINNAASASLYANSGITLAQDAYDFANSIVNDAGTDQYARDSANSAGAYANTGINNAASASLYANSGITLAQAAFDQANTGGDSGIDQYARDSANSAGAYANTGITIGQAAFDAANNASVSGNIVVDSVTSNSYISIPYAIITTSYSFANTASSNTLVDNFDTTIFRGVKYNIQITSDMGYQISELSVVQYDTDVMISEYGLVCSNTSIASLGTFYANVESGLVNLNFNGVGANNVLVVYKVGMANTGVAGVTGSGGPTLPEDLLTGSGTIDLSSGSDTIDLN